MKITLEPTGEFQMVNGVGDIILAVPTARDWG
jgi:hypothetical protein